MNYTFQLPHDQADVIEQYFRASLPQARGRPCNEWDSERSYRLGQQVPVLRLYCGRVVIDAITWGWRASDGTREATRRCDTNVGRRALIAARSLDLPGDQSCETIRIRDAHAEWFMLAGIWRPINEHGENPLEFAMLTMPSSGDLAPYLKHQPMFLDAVDWGRWLIPSNETRAFKQQARHGALLIERVPTEPEERPRRRTPLELASEPKYEKFVPLIPAS